jgi:hypothetical protein
LLIEDEKSARDGVPNPEINGKKTKQRLFTLFARFEMTEWDFENNANFSS